MVARSSGAIVVCWTLSSLRMTTSPPRWSIPRIGGCSFSKVPRPGAPLSRRRRPLRPFFNRLGLPLMAGHDIHLVALDLPGQAWLGLCSHHPGAQVLRHLLNVARAQAQLLGDLPVGEIQPHETPAQNPDPQGLMVAGKHGPGEVVKVALTRRAAILLARRLGR